MTSFKMRLYLQCCKKGFYLFESSDQTNNGSEISDLVLLIAIAESSPLFWSGYFPLYVH
jgi:hypothetical protein